MKKNTQPLKRENEKIADGRHLFASKMDIHQVYVVNPAYKFKSDWNNVVLTNNNPARYSAARQRNDITEGFVWRIHPNLAVLFDSFKGSIRWRRWRRSSAVNMGWTKPNSSIP